MVRRWFLAGVCAVTCSPSPGAVTLTAVERRWLEAAVPVLGYARQQQLPLDIVVQPQPTPGETPVGMAYVDGRCKLVLSMRGNPGAQALLDSMPPGLVGPIVEAIVAHELGHCWRHVQQHWGRLPAGLRDVPPGDGLTPRQAAVLAEIGRARREEAYADLVGLAWTLQHHPSRYAEVHAWHLQQRTGPVHDTGPHDTRVWVQLAGDPTKFARADSIFAQVDALWTAGLLAAD